MATQASNLSFIDNTQGQITISATTATTSTTTGALIVAGGVGIGGTLYVGALRGDSTATTWGLFYNTVTKEITTATGGSGSGGISSTGTTSTFVISSTASSTSTTTGALQVVGGVGIGGSVNIGGTVTGGGIRTTSTSTSPTNPTVGDIWYDTATDDIYRYVTDGTTSSWLDITGPTVSNAGGSGGSSIGTRGLTANQMPAGSIVQAVSTSLNTTFSGNAAGSAISVTGLAASITPTSTSSQILIIAQIMYGVLGSTYAGYFTRNGTPINLGAAGSGQTQVSIGLALVSDLNQTHTFVYSNVDSPNATTSTTYQFWVTNDNSVTIYINRSPNDTASNVGKRGVSTVTLLEIAR